MSIWTYQLGDNNDIFFRTKTCEEKFWTEQGSELQLENFGKVLVGFKITFENYQIP